MSRPNRSRSVLLRSNMVLTARSSPQLVHGRLDLVPRPTLRRGCHKLPPRNLRRVTIKRLMAQFLKVDVATKGASPVQIAVNVDQISRIERNRKATRSCGSLVATC